MLPARIQDVWEEVETFSESWDQQRLADRLGHELSALPEESLPAAFELLLDRLIRRHAAFGVVLQLLGRLSNPVCLERLAGVLEPLPAPLGHDEESHLADLIRILAAANRPNLLGPVEAYLLQRERTALWPTVPWALWPHRRTLFGQAWTRYFVSTERSEWEELLGPFLAEPAAVQNIRRHVGRRSAACWRELRDALRERAHSLRWISAEQRAELDLRLR